MESAPTTRSRTERSAAVVKQIYPHMAQLDLESIKQIAETEKDYFPKDFIAQCLEYFRPDPDNDEQAGLFLDAFTWFVEEFGPTSPGYFGLGKSKEEEFMDPDGGPGLLREFFEQIMDNISDVFRNLSMVVAKSLIESFPGELGIQCAMKDYLERGLNVDSRPPERWGKFKMIVEYLRTRAAVDEDQEYWTIGDDGKVILGHFILLLFVSGILDDILPALLCLKENKPNVFLVMNKQGRTLLDIVIRHRCFYYSPRIDIVYLIVEEDPDACLQRGPDGRLPIHLALRTKDKCLFYLIFNASTSVANQKCPKTHLYPYQLAAVQYTDSNTPDDEAADWSDEEQVAGQGDYACHLPGPNLLLSRIYELLRLSPNLVGDGISPDCRVLSHPESIAIAREELEITRLHDRHLQIEMECAAQHRQIEREQAAKISERKRKHRSSSSQATRKCLKRC
jgi:hypothetical protein